MGYGKSVQRKIGRADQAVQAGGDPGCSGLRGPAHPHRGCEPAWFAAHRLFRLF